MLDIMIIVVAGVIDDWFSDYDQQKRLRDEAFKLKVSETRRTISDWFYGCPIILCHS